jgi:hypothetical protein
MGRFDGMAWCWVHRVQIPNVVVNFVLHDVGHLGAVASLRKHEANEILTAVHDARALAN